MRALVLLLGVCFSIGSASRGADPTADPDSTIGSFDKPPAGGRPWKHEGTGLSFPQQLGSYKLVAQFRYKEGGGVFIRYESTDDRARSDIFFFPHTKSEISRDDMKKAINNELDAVVANFKKMADEGRYRNVVVDEPSDGEIPLWPEGSLPLSVQSIVAMKSADTIEGRKEAQIKQWTGITMLKGHLITIRYTHPTGTGEQGEAALKGFVGTVFQVIKDPRLRAQMKEFVQIYLADPLSAEGQQAATAVLAYIQKTPFVTVPIPVEAIAPWLDQFKKLAPGSEIQLLRAFAMGSAQAGLNDAEPETALTAGAKQFLEIYNEFVRQNPLLRISTVGDLKSAVEHNDVAGYLKRRAMGGK